MKRKFSQSLRYVNANPMRPIPTARSGTVRSTLLAIAIGLGIAASLLTWWTA